MRNLLHTLIRPLLLDPVPDRIYVTARNLLLAESP